jgi:4-hydroxy-tetrahydrodipicolinate reductase
VIRVAVAGALGRMGTVARAALQDAEGIEYVGGLVRALPDDEVARGALFDDLEKMIEERKPDALLDLTTSPASAEISMRSLRQGVRPVIGASGWSDFDRRALEREARERQTGAMLVPNFSIGAALAMRFAGEAAKYFPTVEIVEMHHDKKKDRPSGTAIATAQRIAASGGFGDVPMHSVRLRGLMAHQVVLFGGEGEVLTIRHDCLSREAYAAGMVAAVRAVMELHELVVGLESIVVAVEAAPST